MSKQHKWMKLVALLMVCSVFFLAACTNKDTATGEKEKEKKEEVKEEKPLDGKEIIQKMNESYATINNFGLKVKTTMGTEEVERYEMKVQLKPTEATSITVYDPEVGEINGVYINNLTYIKVADMPQWELVPAEEDFSIALRQFMNASKVDKTYNAEFMDAIDSTEVKQEGDDYVVRIKMNSDKFTLLLAKQQGVSGKFTTATSVVTIDSKTYFPKKTVMSLEMEEQGIKVPTVTEMEYHSINQVEEIKAPK
ncbi:DUF6612 family protein [Priestia taiwanensis]|uniref:Lipoprotein n=1 Tax=Priestia taiwanensis TaxID=1347902 RepID=A0A917ATN2_9BACI|nr:DUF6612 family protein [Priestia taiwanensis]MBM7363718.1 outer membrane lipoprotein-sorting protein [Priestia taiwanensis]GGE74708.1 hypothetical protein GCM10007140_25690 [Priestia taiwanensis]